MEIFATKLTQQLYWPPLYKHHVTHTHTHTGLHMGQAEEHRSTDRENRERTDEESNEESVTWVPRLMANAWAIRSTSASSTRTANWPITSGRVVMP